VNVTCTCGDTTLGIASCSNPQTVAIEAAGEVATGTAVDNAGNKASVSVTINLDKTPPTISAAPDRPANAHGWYRDDVTVGFTCGDTLSGIASCPAAQTRGEGAAQTASGTALDVAGNQASTSLGNLNVDETPPAITGAPDRPANCRGWYRAEVTVAFTCGDTLSGVAGCSTPVTLGEGGGQSVSGVATDKAGNAAGTVVSRINVDQTPPSIAGAPDRAPTAGGWYNADVTVSFQCADGLS